jgi:hypothetical protein
MAAGVARRPRPQALAVGAGRRLWPHRHRRIVAGHDSPSVGSGIRGGNPAVGHEIDFVLSLHKPHKRINTKGKEWQKQRCCWTTTFHGIPQFCGAYSQRGSCDRALPPLNTPIAGVYGRRPLQPDRRLEWCDNRLPSSWAAWSGHQSRRCETALLPPPTPHEPACEALDVGAHGRARSALLYAIHGLGRDLSERPRACVAKAEGNDPDALRG